MRKYTIIAGVNGVGKSSLTGALQKTEPDMGFVIDVDRIAFEENISNIEAGKKAVLLIKEFIEQGVNFSQETTLSGKSVAKTASLVQDRGYKVVMYYIGLNSSQESLNRIDNRVKNGGHNISQSDVMRRFQSRFNDIARVLPFCDEVTFFDNGNGFVRVAEYTKEKGIKLAISKIPLWFDEFLKFFQQSENTLTDKP